MTVAELINHFSYSPRKIVCYNDTTGEYDSITREYDYNQYEFDLSDLISKFGAREVKDWFFNQAEDFLNIEVQ